MTAAPKVLFICVRNAGKSQMAAALANHHGGARLEIHSAGTQPGTSLNTQSMQALAEIGVDMPQAHPKKIDPLLLGAVDRVIILGTEAHLEMPAHARVTVERWITDEPSARGIEGIERMRLIRDDIDVKVRGLVSELLEQTH